VAVGVVVCGFTKRVSVSRPAPAAYKKHSGRQTAGSDGGERGGAKFPGAARRRVLGVGDVGVGRVWCVVGQWSGIGCGGGGCAGRVAGRF
jgi:hypothetical protein